LSLLPAFALWAPRSFRCDNLNVSPIHLPNIPPLRISRPLSFVALFEKAGKAMLMSMGGASGVIFGSLYLAGAKDAEARAELSAGDLAAMLERSLGAIKERGKAQAGDKTMVDALEPAVAAMKEKQGLGLVPMLKAAAEAAEQGMENTKNYQAKFGRAKSLMERAVGFQDPGATSVWIIIRSMHEFAEQHSQQER
jgi:dihydroxyacetone kinase